jgi:hypothetical protein
MADEDRRLALVISGPVIRKPVKPVVCGRRLPDPDVACSVRTPASRISKNPSMKTLLTLAFALTVSRAAFADEVKPLLHDHALPVIAAPGFKEALEAPWSVAKGKWTPKDGVLDVLDVPEDKHIPVLHHKVGLASATIETEFLIDGPGTFLVGCDANKHVGRVVVNGGSLSIAEDSVKPSHTIAKLDMLVKPGEWHHLRVEWTGDRMAANLDGKELRAQHPYLATPKAQSWLAAGKSVHVRNLRISGEAAVEKP